MKVLLLLILSTSLTFSQTTENKHIDSNILNQKREIQIFLPNNYEHSNEKYLTLYVLDGQTYFYYGVGFQQAFNWRDKAPEFIVVGIKSKDWSERRIFFKSPKHEIEFRKFIKQELFPYINKNYRVNDDKMIFGWEDAGDFVLNTLYEKPEMFSAYFVASALKWGDKYLNQFTSKSFKQEKYLYSGHSPSETWSINNYNSFTNSLKNKTPHNLKWNTNTLHNEDHWSTPYQIIYNGIKNYYKPYIPISFASYEDYKSAGGYQNVVNFYKERGLKYGVSSDIHFRTKINILRITMATDNYEEFKFLMTALDYFSKDYIRDFRYINYGEFYMKHGNTEAAYKLLEKGVKEYPWSARIFNCYGNVYKAMGDLKNARLNYKKAIDLANEYSQPGLDEYQLNLKSIQN